jgi:hypothetical protein
VLFDDKNIFFYSQKRSSLLKRCSCKFRSRRIGSRYLQYGIKQEQVDCGVWGVPSRGPMLWLLKYFCWNMIGHYDSKCCYVIPKMVITLGKSFKHNQTWLGQQVCLPGLSLATNLLSSSKKQGDWIVGYLCYFLLAFGHTEIHSWVTSLSPWSELGDKLVCLVTSGYV